MNKTSALDVLAKGKKWEIRGGVLNWFDESPQPTEKEINDKIAELQVEYDAKQYQRDRKTSYPSIEDVVVALAEKEEGDDTMWKEITAKRQKVKADNPKPE
tara:strand:+ start:991 stop:1293 length:303 start_codon:yes stop_codon:yes gene_type:complete